MVGEAIIEGCVKYDRLSQEKLYRQLYPDLLLLCSKFFDDEHDILTALNNGMMQVFNNIEKYDVAKGDLRGWVYVVVRNAAICLVRTKKTISKIEPLTNELQAETSINPFKGIANETAIQYLQTLTTTTRAVFNLFYLEGYLIKEIAVCLDMKEGTVKWHLSDGRSKLKLFFANDVTKRMIIQIE